MDMQGKPIGINPTGTKVCPFPHHFKRGTH